MSALNFTTTSGEGVPDRPAAVLAAAPAGGLDREPKNTMTEDDVPPVGSAWTKPMPYVGVGEDGGAIIGTQHITRRFMDRGLWFVEYVTTFPGTERQGYGTCEVALFLATRTDATATAADPDPDYGRDLDGQP